MSVDIKVGNYQYNYNQAELKSALAAKGLDSAKIDAVLAEIKGGSLESLADLGLTSYVTITWIGGLPRPGLDNGDFVSSLEKMEAVNFLEIMQVLNQAAQELRHANREMRHAERDAAMQESMTAADKIRSSALFNLCFGVVSGAVNIGMGAFSVISSAVQLKNLRSANAELKSSNIEVKAVKADADLGEAQMKLDGANKDMDAIKLQEQKVADLEAQHKAKPTDEQISKDLFDAKKDLAAKQSALEAKLGLPDGELDTPAARTKAMESKIGQMEGEVKALAGKAENANNERMDSLKSDIKAKKAEIDKLEGKTDPKSQARLLEAKNELKGLEAKLDACQGKIDSGLYKNPTDPKHLANGEELAHTSNNLLSPLGAVGTRQSLAQTEFNRVNTRAQTVSGMVQGVNIGSGGLTQVTKSVGDLLAAEQQAQQAEHTAAAQKHSSGESESADYQKAFTDLMESALKLMKECLQAQNQANASIYRNM